MRRDRREGRRADVVHKEGHDEEGQEGRQEGRCGTQGGTEGKVQEGRCGMHIACPHNTNKVQHTQLLKFMCTPYFPPPPPT